MGLQLNIIKNDLKAQSELAVNFQTTSHYKLISDTRKIKSFTDHRHVHSKAQYKILTSFKRFKKGFLQNSRQRKTCLKKQASYLRFNQSACYIHYLHKIKFRMIDKTELHFYFEDNTPVREKLISPHAQKKEVLLDGNSLSTNQREGIRNRDQEKEDALSNGLLLGMNHYFPPDMPKIRQAKEQLNQQQMLRLAYFAAFALGFEVQRFDFENKRFPISPGRMQQIARIKKNLNTNSFKDFDINKKFFYKAHLGNYKVKNIHILNCRSQEFAYPRFIVFDQYKRVVLNFGSNQDYKNQLQDILQVIKDTFKSLVNISYILVTEQKKIEYDLFSKLYTCFRKKNPSNTNKNKNRAQEQSQGFQSLTVIVSSSIQAISLLSSGSIKIFKQKINPTFIQKKECLLKRQIQFNVVQNTQSIMFSTCDISDTFLSQISQKIGSFYRLYNCTVSLLKQRSPFSIPQFYKNSLLLTIIDAVTNQIASQPQKRVKDQSILTKLINRFFNQRQKYMQELNQKQEKSEYHVPQHMSGNCKQCICCEAKADKPRSKTKYQCQGCTSTFGTSVRLCLSCFQDWHLNFQNKHKSKLKIPSYKLVEIIKHEKQKNHQRSFDDNQIQRHNQNHSQATLFCSQDQQNQIDLISKKFKNSTNFSKTKRIYKSLKINAPFNPLQPEKLKQLRQAMLHQRSLKGRSLGTTFENQLKSEVKNEAMDVQRQNNYQ